MGKDLRGGRIRFAPHGVQRDSGMATVEIAIGIPVLLAMGVLAAWCVNIASTALTLGSAASTAARSLARGETEQVVAAQLQHTAPGSLFTMVDEGELVVVSVTREVTPPGPLLEGLALTLTRTSAAAWEWFVPGESP